MHRVLTAVHREILRCDAQDIEGKRRSFRCQVLEGLSCRSPCLFFALRNGCHMLRELFDHIVADAFGIEHRYESRPELNIRDVFNDVAGHSAVHLNYLSVLKTEAEVLNALPSEYKRP